MAGTLVSLWGPVYFQGLLLLVSGSVWREDVCFICAGKSKLPFKFPVLGDSHQPNSVGVYITRIPS